MASTQNKKDIAEPNDRDTANESGAADTHPESDAAAANGAEQNGAGESGGVDQQQKSDISDPDVADLSAADESGVVEAQSDSPKSEKARRRVSVSVRTLLVSMLIASLLASVAALAWLYLGANAKLDDEARQAADSSHAERIALDYAVDAAKINYQDLGAWKKDLVKGTTPELKEKLSSAATSMEQILVPLQWNSTAVPLVAKVRSNVNGIYVVDTFVGVETKTLQAPEGLQSTATYSITIDTKHDWQISEVGGIGAVVGQR